MGNYQSFRNSHCGACTASCHQCEKCSSICLSSRTKQQVVQSQQVASDGSAALEAHHYSVHGSECSSLQEVCGDFGLEDQTSETICDIPASLDQVLPLPEAPCDETEVPNIGERMSMTALEDECRFNASKLKKVRHLAEIYTHWRPIRGDGNCYYRTVVFGALETLLASGAHKRMRRVLDAFQQVRYEMPAEQASHDEMLRRLRSWDSLKQLERWVAMDSAVDQALIRACRRLVRLFLIRHANKLSPNGLTYTELVRALDTAYTCIEDFCLRVVDPMGRDAETLALDALPQMLGVGLRLWILDRRDEVGLVNLDTPGPNGEVDVHVLFKPGHYDLLYPRDIFARVVL